MFEGGHLMHVIVLVLTYVCAAATGALLMASGLYGNAPHGLAKTCDGGAYLCQFPFLAAAGLLALMLLYRWLERHEAPPKNIIAKRLKSLLD
jgi:hypothetical protein